MLAQGAVGFSDEVLFGKAASSSSAGKAGTGSSTGVVSQMLALLKKSDNAKEVVMMSTLSQLVNTTGHRCSQAVDEVVPTILGILTNSKEDEVS